MPTSTNGNGNLTFFSESNAAMQAVLDAQLYASELAGQPSPLEISGQLLATVANAVASAASAGATAGQAGAGLAALVKDSNGNPAVDAVEIEVVNSSSQPLITIGCSTGSCSATEIVQTLLPTASDSFLITSNSNGAFSPSTDFTLAFLIGGSQATAIELGVQFQYTDNGNPGRWAVSTKIDGTPHAYPQNLQLMGAQFLGNATPGYPSFSMYVSPIETASGKMTLTFFDTQQSSN